MEYKLQITKEKALSAIVNNFTVSARQELEALISTKNKFGELKYVNQKASHVQKQHVRLFGLLSPVDNSPP